MIENLAGAPNGRRTPAEFDWAFPGQPSSRGPQDFPDHAGSRARNCGRAAGDSFRSGRGVGAAGVGNPANAGGVARCGNACGSSREMPQERCNAPSPAWSPREPRPWRRRISRLPFVLVYKVSWPTYFAARLVLKTKHLGMPNVLAGREIVPEFIQHEARPDTISKAVLKLMNDQAARDVMISEFDAIIAKLGETGASAKAARVIVDELNRSSKRKERNRPDENLRYLARAFGRPRAVAG